MILVTPPPPLSTCLGSQLCTASTVQALLLVFLSLHSTAPPYIFRPLRPCPPLPICSPLLPPHCRRCSLDDRLFSICWPTPLECEASGSVPVHICCFFKGATADMSLWTCCHGLPPPPASRSFFVQVLRTLVRSTSFMCRDKYFNLESNFQCVMVSVSIQWS